MESTLETLTPTQAAAVGGVAGATIGMMITFGVILYILTVIATWKIFKKAGEPGWKCLIPIYNVYIMYKIVDMKGWFWLILCTSILFGIVISVDGTASYFDNPKAANIDLGSHPFTIIMMLVTMVVGIWGSILYAWRTSKVFGHGVGYFIGLLFLQSIFWLILGFDKSKYNKKLLKK